MPCVRNSSSFVFFILQSLSMCEIYFLLHLTVLRIIVSFSGTSTLSSCPDDFLRCVVSVSMLDIFVSKHDGEVSEEVVCVFVRGPPNVQSSIAFFWD